MMNFDMSATTGVKESGKVLSPGIHKAKFKGLTLDSITSQKDGSTYKVMSLHLDIDGYGDFVSNFFEPRSDQRTESQFGPNPSPAEHFMIALRQIFDAVNPKIGEGIDNQTAKLTGSFDDVVKTAAKWTASAIGTEVEVKLIPQSNGFAAIPSFPARINRVGALGIATRFIGHDLTLSQSEQRKIDQANNARPTNMANNSDASIDGLADALGVTDGKDDLPF
jgi:hypothetical protein